MPHFNFVWYILLGRTIHITGTDKGHTLSVCVQVSIARQTTKTQLNRMMERFCKMNILFWILRAFCCSLHSLAVINDKTPGPHWNDIEGIIRSDLKKGRIDRYHKPYTCAATRTKKKIKNHVTRTYSYISKYISWHLQKDTHCKVITEFCAFCFYRFNQRLQIFFKVIINPISCIHIFSWKWVTIMETYIRTLHLQIKFIGWW